MSALTESPAWKALAQHHAAMRDTHMRDLFAKDDRIASRRCHLEVEDMLVDFSKHRVTGETMKLLFDLARQQKVAEWRDRMFAGEKINRTEDRAVLHVALRNRSNRPILVDGKDVMPEVNAVLAKMRDFTDRVRERRLEGAHGQAHHRRRQHRHRRQRPRARRWRACALKPYWHPEMRAHFVSNVDGTHLAETLKERRRRADALHRREQDVHDAGDADERAAARARGSSRSSASEAAVPKHFVAVSTATEEVKQVRHRHEQHVRVLGLGRRALLALERHRPAHRAAWSALDHFEEMLAGGHAMDEHFRTAPLEKNVPGRSSGMLGVWYSNFFGAQTHAILPYDQYMSRFAAYFQQGDMESNGKRVDREGRFIDDYTTGPIVWGEPGTNGQHAFYQLIHQGTRLVPCDFLAPLETHNPLGKHHEVLLANFFAQTEALMRGKTPEEARAELEAQKLPAERVEGARPAQDVPGQPADDVDPLHEAHAAHARACSSRCTSTRSSRRASSGTSISFDQWGVELGKQLAKKIEPELESKGAVDVARRVDQRAHQPLQEAPRRA